LNVYVALCYCKLDYYDVSLEILQVYLQAHPQSALAVNLKACNHFRLYNGKAAEAELKQLPEASLQENDLVRHNLVVFRNGENALQVSSDPRVSLYRCSVSRLNARKAAEAEFKQLSEAGVQENDVVKHNLFVSRHGEIKGKGRTIAT
jgi:hypothetical protein